MLHPRPPGRQTLRRVAASAPESVTMRPLPRSRVKFEVRYPTGARHDVTLQGTLAVLGRDPSCDLVLNDVKCSRRHAVIEAGPHGMAIRDSGSANGVYVNGRRVERSVLAAGDVVRLGEIVIKVLPEEMGGTVAMGPDELREVEAARASVGPVELGTPQPSPARKPVPPPPPPPRGPTSPAERPSAEGRPVARGPLPRPLTVTLLAALWGLAVLIYLGLGAWVGLSTGLRGWARVGGAAFFALAALLGLVLCAGLWTRRPWARWLQLAVALLGLLNLPFALAALTVLVYLLRDEARVAFSGRRDRSELGPEELAKVEEEAGEAAFAATLLGTVLLGVLITAGLLFWAHGRLASTPAASPAESEVLTELREMAAAQRQFREGTAGACPGAYADLDGLRRPAEVIPNYKASGPAFVGPEFEAAERHGYRFTLEVEEPLPATEGCPKRAFRHYRYLAAPLGSGRHFALESDGRIHGAADHPASAQDPPIE